MGDGEKLFVGKIFHLPIFCLPNSGNLFVMSNNSSDEEYCFKSSFIHDFW